ncbi:MAG: DEAD/DEAH box helicase family protein [Thermoproteota archaeon]|nr:DEAD/DEAH box helicase family protein [Thermoproteota archaeon]
MAINTLGSEEQKQQLLSPPVDKTKIPSPSLGQARIKERNIVSVQAKKTHPQFIYNRAYIGMQPGKCLEYNLSDDTSLLTRDERFQEFMDRPYAVIPQGNHKKEEKAYLLISPKWTGFRAGWLESQTETYNIFTVDRYSAWSGLVPDDLKEELDLDPRYSSIKILQNGDYLVGNEFELEDAWIRYREYLLRKEKDIGIRVKSTASARFNLASKLVSDGVIPWTSRTVSQSWMWLTDIKLRPYQQEAMDFFITHGAMTLVYPFGAGKTLFGVQVISCISDRTLVVVPSVSHIAVWQKYIEEHLKKNNNNTNGKPRIAFLYGGARKDAIKYADIIISTYESALTYLTDERFKLLIFDECHHFPASTYSRLAFLDADYRLGLSGSPYREDGRSELIYVLSGYPYGSDWDKLFEEGWVKKPEINLHVTSAKITFLQSLLQTLKGNTIVFSDSLTTGEESSRLTGLPFIYGEHTLKERIEALNKHKRFICSRIFDEGMDIPDVKNIIEIDFLGGSRRQQLQRVGRLMHSLIDGVEYHLLMSPEELQKYERRLYGLYSRQFKVNLVKY